MDLSAFPPIAAVLDAASALLTWLAAVLDPLVGSWAAAAAIVLVTLAVRAALIPLGVLQVRAELQRRRLAPKLAELQRRHTKNPELRQRKIMELYRAEGVSPFAGMLPALAQLPVVSVLYAVFVSDTLHGRPNALLDATLAGVPLGDRLTGLLGASMWMDAAVPLVVMALIAVTAFFTRRQSLRFMASSPAPVDPRVAGFGRLTSWLSFSTVLIAALVPLAAALYLVVSTAWTLVERTIMRRRLAPE